MCGHNMIVGYHQMFRQIYPKYGREYALRKLRDCFLLSQIQSSLLNMGFVLITLRCEQTAMSISCLLILMVAAS